MYKKKTGVLILFLSLVGGIIAWSMLREKISPEFAHLQQLQERLINDETLTEDERETGWAEVKQKWSMLSESEQEALKARGEQKKQEEIDRYFELKTEEERSAFLDNVIDQWEDKSAKKKNTHKDNDKDKDGTEHKKKESQKKAKQGTKEKRHDPEAMRAGLRKHLDATTADDRVRGRIYWTALKHRWAERHGYEK